jgi:hypothetical protein
LRHAAPNRRRDIFSRLAIRSNALRRVRCFVVVDDVQLLAVDLKAKDRSRVRNPEIPRTMDGKIAIDVDLTDRLSRSHSVISFA